MSNRKKTILIVDDAEINRQILALILRDHYCILEAANGKEALDIVKKQHENIDLIMLDILMPVMNGFKFLERKKTDIELQHVDIPVIFVTSETYRENILKGLQGGVCDVIAKPFDPQLVCTRVDHLIKLMESKEKRHQKEGTSTVHENKKRPDTVLIVDDMELNRIILKTALEDSYEVLEANNGQEALELLEANKENIAIILLDVIMPVMDGVEMMKLARRRRLFEGIPIIAITTEDSPVKMQRLKELGICEIIHKPFDLTVVKNRVENMIELYAEGEELVF